MLRRTAVVASVVVALLVGLAGQVRAGTITLGTRIAISPTEFALPVEIVDAVGLAGWEFSLLYDATIVQVDTGCDPFVDTYCDLLTGAVTEGAFFAAGMPFNVLNPGAVLLDLITGEQTGTLLASQGLYGGPLPAPSGDGVLAYVRFNLLSAGETPIDIQIVDASANEPTTVPEPSTLLLMTLGLPFVRRRRRRSRSSFPPVAAN
jgi:hypothetical protein